MEEGGGGWQQASDEKNHRNQIQNSFLDIFCWGIWYIDSLTWWFKILRSE